MVTIKTFLRLSLLGKICREPKSVVAKNTLTFLENRTFLRCSRTNLVDIFESPAAFVSRNIWQGSRCVFCPVMYLYTPVSMLIDRDDDMGLPGANPSLPPLIPRSSEPHHSSNSEYLNQNTHGDGALLLQQPVSTLMVIGTLLPQPWNVSIFNPIFYLNNGRRGIFRVRIYYIQGAIKIIISAGHQLL